MLIPVIYINLRSLLGYELLQWDTFLAKCPKPLALPGKVGTLCESMTVWRMHPLADQTTELVGSWLKSNELADDACPGLYPHPS